MKMKITAISARANGAGYFRQNPKPRVRRAFTIRLDQDIVDRFLELAEQSGGANGYQTLINAALREYLDGKAPKLRTRYAASFARNSTRVQLDSRASRPTTARCNWWHASSIEPTAAGTCQSGELPATAREWRCAARCHGRTANHTLKSRGSCPA
jgi:uncharacterized protein (DUF4415 family)